MIAAEKGCYPNSARSREYPDSPTPFRYVNAGGYIGYAGFIKNVLKSITIQEGFSDQGQLTEYFLKNKFPFVLDHYSQIFLCLHDTKASEVVIESRLGSVRSLITKSYPLIVHDNGYNEANLYQRIYELLILGRSDASLPIKYQQGIAELVDRNPYQLSVNEYLLIAETLHKKAPCNMLVFGVGKDSSLWMELNRGGNTVFLEDQESWLESAREQLPGIDAYQVSYRTTRTQWRKLLKNPQALWMELPKSIFERKWDIIFVDAPHGHIKTSPGRMQSIYMAALLAHRDNSRCEVFIHDCDRNVEAAYSDRFFHDEHLKTAVDRLRHYAVP